VPANVDYTERARVQNQLAQDTASARQVPDPPPSVFIHPRREEMLQAVTALVHDRKGRIPRPRHLPRHLRRTIQHKPGHNLIGCFAETGDDGS
jgi:hypothetical protein